jgi:3-methyladenine DNA glycosylase/8-oxoguanine DNA glycosylase
VYFDLRASSPFVFYSTIHSHGWYQLAPSRWDEERRVLTRPEALSNGRVIALTLTGVEQGVRVATSKGVKLTRTEAAELGVRIRWMLALDANYDAFYALADREPRLAHCRAHARGRWLRSTGLFEDVVKMMMTTNIQWSGTKRLTAALVAKFGQPVDGDVSLRSFPGPDVIARSRESTLRGLGLGYRAPYLLTLARGVASGLIDLEGLRDASLPTLELRKRLIALPGIGPYAAAALLALLGRYDFIPIDTEAVSAVGGFFYGGKKVGEKEINAVFERWGEYRALAYWFWDYDGSQSEPTAAER